MNVNTQGLILRETNYRDSDKILTVLTRSEGKLTVKARGCRRRNSRLAAATQLLVYSEMSLFGYRDRWSLNEADSLEQFWGVRADVTRLALCSYFAEAAETVAEEERSDPALLSLILNAMYALDQLNKPQGVVKAAFELKLMSLEGYEPLLDACAVCGAARPKQPRLYLNEGVLCCASCRVADGAWAPLTDSALAVMRHIVYGDPNRLFSFRLDMAGMDCLSRACETFLTVQLERGFSTLEFYKDLIRPRKPLEVWGAGRGQRGEEH